MSKETLIKVSVLGCSYVGKTAIINQLISKSFQTIYEPTLEIQDYGYRINLNDDEVAQKTYINLIIQDTFGLNNSLLNKPPELITSRLLREKRIKMTQQFKDIMFTSNEKRNEISSNEKSLKFDYLKKEVNEKEEIFMDVLGQVSKHIERSGFIFVCDCENSKSVESILKIIEKLQEIEKTNNLIYPKVILFNKCDKLNEKTFKENMRQYAGMLENFNSKFKIRSIRVSAMTGQGIEETFKAFLSKIHQEIKTKRQNDGIAEPVEDEELKIYQPLCVDNLNSCSKKVLCGNRIFVCGVRLLFILHNYYSKEMIVRMKSIIKIAYSLYYRSPYVYNYSHIYI